MILKRKDFVERLKKSMYHNIIKIKGKDIDELEKYVYDNISTSFSLNRHTFDKETNFNHLCMMFEKIINLYNIKINGNNRYTSRLNLFCVLTVFINGFKYINENINKEFFISKLRFMIDECLNSDPNYKSILQKFDEKQIEFIHGNVVDFTDIQKAYRDYYNNDNRFVMKLDEKLFDDDMIDSAMNGINFDVFITNDPQTIKKCFTKIITILLCNKYISNNKYAFIRYDGIVNNFALLTINFEANIDWSLSLHKSDITLRIMLYITSIEKRGVLSDAIDAKDLDSYVVLR